jgi:mitochondrial protein MBA1
MIASRLFYFLRWSRPKSIATRKKTKLPWNLVERTLIARTLHRQYYIALSEEDMSTINKIACKGLILSSQRRIAQLKYGTNRSFHIMEYLGMKYPQFLRWPLLSFLPFSATKIVSDKVSPLPFGKNSLLRQCVVRIRTRQSLDRDDGTDPKIAELTEYVVIQRMRIEEQDEGWKIWGTTKPSTMEEIEKIMGGSPTAPRLRDTLQGQFTKLTGM